MNKLTSIEEEMKYYGPAIQQTIDLCKNKSKNKTINMCLNDFKNLLIKIDVATNKKYNLKMPKPVHEQLINYIENQIPYFMAIVFGFTSFCLGVVLACTGVYYLAQVL